MSNFKCEKCGKICYDTPNGYITGCEHYPADLKVVDKPKKNIIISKQTLIDSQNKENKQKTEDWLEDADKVLRERYTNGGYVILSFPSCLIREQVEKELKEAGWSWEYLPACDRVKVF